MLRDVVMTSLLMASYLNHCTACVEGYELDGYTCVNAEGCGDDQFTGGKLSKSLHSLCGRLWTRWLTCVNAEGCGDDQFTNGKLSKSLYSLCGR